jgi:hypothetical protein
MSDSFLQRLKCFTPDGSGLDRDRLLFDLGRQTARRNRWWPALSSILAMTQVITLALFLWARPMSPSTIVNQHEIHPKKTDETSLQTAAGQPSSLMPAEMLPFSSWQHVLEQQPVFQESVPLEAMLESLDIDAGLRSYLQREADRFR